MLDRRPERLDGLTGQGPATAIDDRHRDPPWQFGRDVEGRGDRRLGVERVEDRLDQEQVHTTIAQRGDLVGVA